MDVELEVKFVCVNCGDKRTQLGFIFTSLGATNTDIRLTIKEDELTTFEFQMLSAGGSIFFSRQEQKMKLKGDLVHIRVVASSNIGDTNKCILSKNSIHHILKGRQSWE